MTRRLCAAKFAVIFALVLIAFPNALAQRQDQYVISAKAGGINFVSGEATVKRRSTGTAESVTTQTSVDSGDVVSTGLSGRVEVLLIPGSYLRAAENTEFELSDATLESLRLRLIRGSAVIEATGDDDVKSLFTVNTSQSTVTIDQRGLYRIDVLSNGLTEVFVRKGRALVRNATGEVTKLEEGKSVRVTSNESAISKFDKKVDRDYLDAWSRERAEELAAANRRLSDRSLASAYSSYRSGLGSSRWGFGSSSGLWLYDPFLRGRTFLPLYAGLSSPYGHRYSRCVGLSRGYGGFYSPFSRSTLGGIRIGIGGRNPRPFIVRPRVGVGHGHRGRH